jgi:hypothetical protein
MVESANTGTFREPESKRTKGSSPQASHIIRFGVLEVDLRAGELRKSGAKIRMQEQPFQILAMLLERPSEVVTREELRQKLWPADTFVDFEHGVNAAVARLRETRVTRPTTHGTSKRCRGGDIGSLPLWRVCRKRTSLQRVAMATTHEGPRLSHGRRRPLLVRRRCRVPSACPRAQFGGAGSPGRA